jgi:hypothetical protein
VNTEEVLPVIDVHPPNEPIHGWRDFFLHLTTITIGLLIALGLEGCVEWQHHRHLVHEAEVSLHSEIQANANDLGKVQADVHRRQTELNNDVVVLKKLIKDPTLKDQHMSVNFRIVGFDSVSWKTAQSTGALSYMPYSKAEEYSTIYNLQDEFDVAQKQAARDAILSIGPFLNEDPGDPPATPAQLEVTRQHIEVLQAQLILVDSLVTALNTGYKNFLTAHPN